MNISTRPNRGSRGSRGCRAGIITLDAKQKRLEQRTTEGESPVRVADSVWLSP